MTSNEFLLTIGYSTLAQRASNINFPQNSEGRQLLVVVQNPNQDELRISNKSIDLVELSNRGVAKSRNAALSNAKGKYLIFGDDDIKFLEAELKKLLD